MNEYVEILVDKADEKIFYSPLNNAFYSTYIMTEESMPEDRKEITREKYEEVFSKVNFGYTLGSDSEGNPIAVKVVIPLEHIIYVYKNSTFNLVEETAVKEGFTSMNDALSWLNDEGTTRCEKAKKLKLWRSNVWDSYDSMIVDITENDGIDEASIKAFLDLLPKFES